MQRLEEEEFILQESSSLDDKGLASTHPDTVKPKDKGKGSQASQIAIRFQSFHQVKLEGSLVY